MLVRRRIGIVLAGATVVFGGCAGDGEEEADSSTSTVAVEVDGDGEPDMGGTAADGAGWSAVAVEGGPPPTTDAVLAVATDGSLWLHGGRVAGEPVTDLWRFDGETWEQVAVEGAAPDARFDHVGVWDASGDRLVVATGQATATELFDDVWAFDPSAGTWERLATGGPRARYGSCAALDGEGRMVISHGFSLEQRFGDTWAFDLRDESWSEITPQDGPHPRARCLHACGWDADADELVLFGGRTDDAVYVGDTWRLGEDGWREIEGTGPSERVHAAGVYVDDAFLLVGGEGPEGLPGGVWLLGGDAWSVAPGEGPSERHSHAIAEREGVVWVFGGASGDGDLADLWRLN